VKKKELFHLIKHPFQISFKEYQRLEEVSAKYPYFSILNMILAKASKELNLPEAQERLYIAALQSIDRKVLKALIEFKVELETKSVAPIPENEGRVEKAEKKQSKKAKKIKAEKAEQIEEQTYEIQPEISEREIETELPEEKLEIVIKEELSLSSDQPESRIDQKKIIDEFINKNVSIIKIDLKDEDTSSQLKDLSKNCAQLPEDLVSENLAALLAKQGKKQKAIATYEKLILKFPEKRTYFAALIEDLKKD
jgi:tetratricopeptide (TPR) repeat protein